MMGKKYSLVIQVKINYWAFKLWLLRKIGIVYDPDNFLSTCPFCEGEGVQERHGEWYTCGCCDGKGDATQSAIDSWRDDIEEFEAFHGHNFHP